MDAAQILRGEWKPTPDAIAFDEKGKMINGQHRCLAIAKAGQACLCLVVYDGPRSSYEVIDTGINRSSGDVLGFMNVASGKAKAAIATLLLHYEKRSLPSRAGSSNPSRHEVVTYYSEHREEIESAHSYCGNEKNIGFISRTNLCTAYILFSRSDKDLASRFLHALAVFPATGS